MRRTLLSFATVAVVLPLTSALPASGQSTAPHLTPEFLAAIDDAVLSGSVTPPGAEVTEKSAELEAYENLVWGYPSLTREELTTVYFKDSAFDEPTIGREYWPRADVRVVRDAEWGAPHIYGETDIAAAFGAGYVSAEDRLAIMELLRALGRSEAFQLIGDTPTWLADAEMARLYGYTDQEFQDMIDRLPEVYGQTGQDLVDLLEELVKGINHFIVQAQQGHVPMPAGIADLGIEQSIAPWTTKDVVAEVSTVRALFGAGGGAELSNAATFLSLVETYGLQDGTTLYEDFRQRHNLDGPLHTTDGFPYMPVPEGDPRAFPGNAFGLNSGDSGLAGLLGQLGPGLATSASAADFSDLAEQARIKWENVVIDLPGGHGRLDLSSAGEPARSNYIAAGGSWMESGTPFLVGGPQAGYFDPQILMDNEIHGDRLHAIGSTFPGFGLVIVGRTADAAWSPTAGGSDMIDMYIELLCDPDGGEPDEQEVHYVHDGDCVPMDRRVIREAPVPLPGEEALPDIIVERTVHGPLAARGRLGDVAVAVARKRSTYLKELDPGVSIIKINRGEARTARDFVEIFRESHNLATNWGYINDSELGYVHGGLYPVRPADIHPDFPVWGTGEWEWQTTDAGDDVFLGVEDVPYETNPDRDYIVSWNNRVAPEWSASDANWGYSALYRADMLEDQLLAKQKGTVTPMDVVALMEQAGLTDLRGSHVYPLALAVIEESGIAVGAREQEMIGLLDDWMAEGALRRDGDQDGAYDHDPAVAIADAWWNPLIDGMYNPALGQSVSNVSRQGRHNAPNNAGSAFQGGFYGQVWTDLATVLGRDVNSPTSQVFCGSSAVGTDGTLADCASAVLDSLVAAGNALGGGDPDAWGVDASAERILFLPNAALSMHWVNRPTTQAHAQFSAEPSLDPALPVAVDGDTPSTGGGLVGIALVPILLIGAAWRRRRVQMPVG